MTRLNAPLALLAVAGSLAACGSTAVVKHPDSRRSPAATTSAAVTIADYAFHPPSLNVPAGTRVTFVNRDATAHTATATGGGAPAFDTGTVRPGGRASIVLRKPGTYTYYCQFHAFMRATIVVTHR